MPIVEDLKEYAERATGFRRPGKRAVANFVRQRKPHGIRFKDDGLVPNHPPWPLVIYRSAVNFDERHDPAAVFEDLFEANGWGDTWRDGIYDYVHYHSRIHEALGIARGKGRVRFGGKKGRIFTLKAGTWRCCLPERATNVSPPPGISLSSELIRRPEPMMCAPSLKTVLAPSRPFARSDYRAGIRSTEPEDRC